ncbi:4-hydroxy-tetrahydrodipicolinate reductase [Clostridium homopropionicum DSM 5847]|uniref:4-hydroxy-tetrahydrodipicolinate reductase n=1 Tax=Clostridium homopropionicum DSM 5847 TaxID=1121318 RepID=A0A0L6ZB65_9CLOT|nr:4-hydroxy-tetrahydrodipicolinate reductase [Clostridium homopropionicum]KOA20214.1 4-hydroxy-tetrahydrodipicolinate reductase [Clostridium homopropionicum DSM 5847]SFG58849.1 dihydrodipicolinate reductase [Clostridium homopropionicum]
MKKILLCGCLGKMGRVITQSISNFPNLEIAAGVDMQKDSSVKYPIFAHISECTIPVDVVLDFSRPEALDSLLDYCSNKNLPLVLCTTGYSEEALEKVTEYSNKIPVFKSANMSIGINLINGILKNISAMLYNNYDIEIIEKHHNQKVDSPSGTALLLANSIKDSIPEETNFVYGREGIKKREHKEIGIHAVRGGSIVGDHQIIFAGQGEIIELSHYALSREVFAIGALKASEFMCGKEKGFYTMDDVLK